MSKFRMKQVVKPLSPEEVGLHQIEGFRVGDAMALLGNDVVTLAEIMDLIVAHNGDLTGMKAVYDTVEVELDEVASERIIRAVLDHTSTPRDFRDLFEETEDEDSVPERIVADEPLPAPAKPNPLAAYLRRGKRWLDEN